MVKSKMNKKKIEKMYFVTYFLQIFSNSSTKIKKLIKLDLIVTKKSEVKLRIGKIKKI